MVSQCPLFSLCAKKLSLTVKPNQIAVLSNYLPLHICNIISKLQNKIFFLQRIISSPICSLNVKIPEECYVVDTKTELDFESTALLLEPFLSHVDFFDLCSKLALDEPTERVYKLLSQGEQKELLVRDSVVWCRALELSSKPAILYYDDIALSCAAQGLNKALERLTTQLILLFFINVYYSPLKTPTFTLRTIFDVKIIRAHSMQFFPTAVSLRTFLLLF